MEDYPLVFETPEQEQAFKLQVEEWYAEFGEIYTTELNEVVFVFRGLSLAELRRANKLYEDAHDRAEYICRMCVLSPFIEDYSLEIYAGIPDVLCQTILDESGYGEDASKINALIYKSEQEMEQAENRIPLIIKEVFQDIPLEAIENFPIEKLIYYYSRAKWTLENLRGITLTNGEDEPQNLM